MGLSRRTALRHKATIAPSVPSLAGFYPNGASNTALKTMIARVKAGTGRGTMVWKGDSTSIETGAGAGAVGLDNARSKGLKPTLASLLTAAGLPTLDKAVYGDGGLAALGIAYPGYDPRVSMTGWSVLSSQGFAGGGIFQDSSGGAFTLTESGVDSFEFVAYQTGGGITYAFLIDGAAPAFGPATLTTNLFGGFIKATVKAAAVGTHTLSVTCNSSNPGFRSIKPFDSTVKALDILCHASGGAQSPQQAAAGNGFQNMDALTYDAPDLTFINVVLNDVAAGVSVADTVSNNAAMVTAAQTSGSVLLVFPQPAGQQFEGLAPYNAALKAWASSHGIPFFSFWEHYGSPATLPPAFGARLYDGLVHPREELYVEMAGLLKQVIDAMAA